jgi:hypothetical protein
MLVAFLTIHLIVLSIAAAAASRETLLPAVPAALLTVWGAGALADRLGRVLPGSAAPAVCRQLPAVVVLLLMVWARPDHQTAASVFLRSSDAVRALTVQLNAIGPRPVNLTLVNLPSSVVERGIGAHTFANGIDELVRSTRVNLLRFEFRWISKSRTAASFASGSVRISPDDLRARLRDPSGVVLFFDESLNVQPLTLDRIDALVAR